MGSQPPPLIPPTACADCGKAGQIHESTAIGFHIDVGVLNICTCGFSGANKGTPLSRGLILLDQ